MWILISFCNSVKRLSYYSQHGLSQLAALDLNTSRIYFLRIPSVVNPRGFTGVAHQGEFVYAVTQGEKSAILLRIHKRGLKVDLAKDAKSVKDPHSMIFFHERLYIVSSGTNSIEMFDPRTFEYLGRYWQYPDTLPVSDRVHLNSLLEADGQIWTSAFGRKVKNKWSLTTNGSLINTADNSHHYRINHPHSATFYRGNFYYCESQTGSVYRDGELIKKIEGAYTRGLGVDSDYVAVGLNSGRVRSRSRGILNSVGEVSRYHYYCGVAVIDKRRHKEIYFDFSPFFRETTEYACEVYALKFAGDIRLNNLAGIVSCHKINSKPAIEEKPIASMLMMQKQALEIKLSKVIRQRNRLIDERDVLKRKLAAIKN